VTRAHTIKVDFEQLGMLASIGDVLQIIVSQDWETFRSALLSSPALFRNWASAISACSQLNGMTLLHAVVRHNPPVDIIVRMIEICPNMPAAKDCVNRTPLHVAAGSKASATVLNVIARAHPAACNAQDDEGKTPLHFACDSSCVLFEGDDRVDTRTRQPPNHDSVAALLLHSFHASILKDDEDMSPRELAILSNASTRTVNLLYACQREAREWQRQRALEAVQRSVAVMSISTRDSDNSSLRTRTVCS